MTDRDYLAAARERLPGEPRQSLSSLRWVFREEGLPADEDRLVQALAVLAEIGHALGDHDFADLVERAASSPLDGDALYDLGYALFERCLYEAAVAVLRRAHVLFPGEERIVAELVAALEEDGNNPAACEVLRGEGELLASSFVCRYLLAFNLVMSGDLEAARPASRDLAPSERREHFMARRIAGMLGRADAIASVSPLDREDLRGWHFVATGGLLLHLSPYGYGEGMRGRYAFTQDSYSRCRLGLDRLRAALEALGLGPARLLRATDRGSEALALAAASVLGLPVEPLDDGPGLVVAYDLAEVSPEDLERVAARRAGQLVFAHAACWTDPPPFVPDVATYLYQSQTAPWGERLRFEPGGGEPTHDPGSAEPAAVLAERVVAAPAAERGEETAPRDAASDLAAFCAAAAGAFATGAAGERRERFWGGGGPVKSSRFG